MKRIRYQVISSSPLLLTFRVGDANMVSTHEYIPGSSLLGHFAGKYIKSKNLSVAHEDATFHKWFLDGSLIFTNAYIVKQTEKGKINFIPTPLSLQKLKDNPDCIWDFLYKEDDNPSERISENFVSFSGSNIHTLNVEKSLNFHHERNPDTGTSMEGIIFNYESLSANQTFEGNIIGEKNELENFIEQFGQEDIIFLGRSKNTQYGKCNFKIISNEIEDYSEKWDKDLNNSEGEFSLTLLSNTIIYNDQGFSTTDISALENALSGNIKIIKSFIRKGEVESYVSVWRLRKPSEVCFLAGSSFLIKIPQKSLNHLKKLQAEGVGERTQEGFGRIAFGIQKNIPGYTLLKDDISSFSKPNNPLPSLTKEITAFITKDYLLNQAKSQAIKDAQEFYDKSKLPSKSLIGRLEAMIRTGGLINISDLRKPAKDQLEDCKNSSQTLLDFINNFSPQKMLEKSLDKLDKPNLTELGNLSEQPYDEAIKVLRNAIYKQYFQTFFSTMRRLLKRG